MSDDLTHSSEPESSGLTGVQAVKYLTIVATVLLILAFVAWYVMPVMSP